MHNIKDQCLLASDWVTPFYVGRTNFDKGSEIFKKRLKTWETIGECAQWPTLVLEVERLEHPRLHSYIPGKPKRGDSFEDYRKPIVSGNGT